MENVAGPLTNGKHVYGSLAHRLSIQASSIVTSVEANVAPAIAFLQKLDADGRHNLVAIDPVNGSLSGKTFDPRAWTEMAQWIEARDGRQNLYFSVNEPRPGASNDKLKKADIAFVRAIFADVDPADGMPLEDERKRLDELFRSALAKTPAPPSWTWDTGGGCQALWLLGSKVAIDGAQTAAEELGRGAAIMLGGDAVQNVDRIGRLPGTVNIPDVGKLAKGRVTRRGHILFEGDARYTLESLAQHIQPRSAFGEQSDLSPEIAAAIGDLEASDYSSFAVYGDLPEALRHRFELACTFDPTLKQIWSGTLDQVDRSGSEYRRRLAVCLGRATLWGLTFDVSDFASLASVWNYAEGKNALNTRMLARDWVRCGWPEISSAEAFLASWFEKPEQTAERETQETRPARSLFPEIKSDEANVTGPADIFGHDDPAELGSPPAGSMPDVLTRWMRSEARRKGVPEAFAAVAAMTVCAAAIGNSCRIQPRQHDTGWCEPAGFWTMLVAPPGSAKSPIIGAAVAPLRKLDSELYADWKSRHDPWLKASKSKRKDAPDPGPEPVCRRAIADDFTMERAIRMLAENPQGLLCAPDELMSLLGGLGAYKKSGDGDQGHLLKLFDGGPITVDRVIDGSIRAESALLGIIAGTQPDKLRGLTARLGLDGTLQRFLPVLHDGQDRTGIDEAPDHDALQAYARIVRGLANLSSVSGAPALRLAPDAAALLASEIAQFQALQHMPGASPAFGGHCQKWGKLLPRIILTFHCVDQLASCGLVDPSELVQADVVRMAARFGRFLMRHSIRFYEQFASQTNEASDARWIADFLLTRPDLKQVVRHNISDAKKAFRGEGDRALRAAIADLVAAAWLIPQDMKADGPSQWRVNPDIHVRFAKHAVRAVRERKLQRDKIEAAAQARRLIDGGPEEQNLTLLTVFD